MKLRRGRLRRLAGIGLAGCVLALGAHAQVPPSEVKLNAKDIVDRMMSNEDAAMVRKDRYEYLSQEKSDRTGGHLWREKVVETAQGKVRFLVAEDNQPLSPERIAVERGHLADILADPTAFAKKEQAMRADEIHAKEMLSLVRKAFLFGEVKQQGGELEIDFRPDPGYAPQSMEERVLHGMSGTMLIDASAMRLHRIDGRLPADVSIGFGFLATIRAGSSFATVREPVAAASGVPEWKTIGIDTDINGKAIFFKAIAKNEHATHTEFIRVPKDLTLAQAVEIAER
jgi:hypothetical protein